MKYQHILGEIFNKPMLATPALMYDAVVFAKHKLGLNVSGFSAPQAMHYDDDNDGDVDDSSDNDYPNGIANIGVYGPLVARTGNLNMCSRMTAYESIAQQFVQAINDPACLSIVFDLDTPGGSVSGAFDLANLIYANRGVKPITAIVNHSAYSAGYLIASACDSISLSDTGGVGSIGVLMQHLDYSKMLDEEGIKVTTLTRGANKADGNPYEPLSDGALAEYNGLLDTYYNMFTGFVAKARGMSVDAVVATQARCFTGQAAINAGLADALETPMQAIQRIFDSQPKPVLFDPLAQRRMQAKSKLAEIS